MTARTSLVGRDAEMQRLIARLDRARSGEGGIVLLSGEAGVGKTRLVTELVRRSPDALVICGAAVHSGTAPYGPVVTALRTRLRSEPDALAGCGPLASHLAMILPELGPPAAATDRPTLLEAVRCALAHLARERLTVMVLDDLHWSDEATLELLSALAEPLAELSVLVLGAYRSDGLPRGHGLRRLRHELRRAGRLDELALGPLDRDGVARLLGSVLGRSPAPSLVRAVDDATQGTPFFVEELAGALLVSGGLQDAGQGLELTRHGEVPLPETVRDAVLVGASELSEAARAAAAAAAVAGETFDLELVGSLSSPEGVAELLERGIAREHDGGAAVFRHGLTREALYADVPWMRRRSLHRAIAAALEAAGAPSGAVAAHWLGARDGARARRALLTAAAEAEAVHAFRDGAEAGHKALELWPEGEEEALRADALERCARCAWARPMPTRRATGASSPSSASASDVPTPSAGWRRCSSCAASASRPSPHGAWRRTGSRPTARPPRPRSSCWRWPTSGGCRPGTARRCSSPSAHASRRTPPRGSTCACARSACRGWRAPSTATTTPASRRSAPRSPWRWTTR